MNTKVLLGSCRVPRTTIYVQAYARVCIDHPNIPIPSALPSLPVRSPRLQSKTSPREAQELASEADQRGNAFCFRPCSSPHSSSPPAALPHRAHCAPARRATRRALLSSACVCRAPHALGQRHHGKRHQHGGVPGRGRGGPAAERRGGAGERGEEGCMVESRQHAFAPWFCRGAALAPRGKHQPCQLP